MTAFLVTAIATDGEAARSALTRNERLKCGEFENPRRREDFRAGRLAAKCVGRQALGIHPTHLLEVRSVVDGPPRLRILDHGGRDRDAGIELSISHRDGRAVAVAAPAGVRVGVDLEATGSVPRKLARYFLTPAEEDLSQSCDVAVLWSMKEAAWKALGLGRTTPFKALELCCDQARSLRGVRVHGAFLPMSATIAAPWTGYHVATVWMNGGLA